MLYLTSSALVCMATHKLARDFTQVIDLEALVNADLPKLPVDVTFTTHWLAIEGVQPEIPQNPPVVEHKGLLILGHEYRMNMCALCVGLFHHAYVVC